MIRRRVRANGQRPVATKAPEDLGTCGVKVICRGADQAVGRVKFPLPFIGLVEVPCCARCSSLVESGLELVERFKSPRNR